MNMQDSQVIAQLVQGSIVNWANIIDSSNFVHFQRPILTIMDTIEGNFLLNLLSSIPKFKLGKTIKPEEQIQQQDLGVKVSVIKIIGKSIINYYQTILLRDTSSVCFNYVEISMGNKKEIIRFFSAVVGILWQTKRDDLNKQVTLMQVKNQQVFQILIENAKKIGQSLSSNRSQASPQAKFLTRLEILEEKIQQADFTHQANQKLIIQLEEDNNLLKNKNKELQSSLFTSIQQNELLSDIISKYQNQTLCDQIVQDTWRQRYLILKHNLESQITLHIDQRKKLQGLLKAQRKELQFFHQLKIINEELKQQIHLLNQQKKDLSQLNSNLRQTLQSQRKLTQQFVHQKARLAVQVEELKLLKADNHNLSDFEIMESEESQNSARLYRNKQNLSYTLNQSDNVMMANSFLKENRIIIDRKLQDTPILKSQRKKQNYNEANIYEEQTRSLVKQMCEQHKIQVNLLIQVISDLYSDLKLERQDLLYERQLKERRKIHFIEKVKNMFQKDNNDV